MAEQEIIKHTKAVYKVWQNPHTSWKHKLKDMLFEILIIVFAITVSLWFHNLSEKSHDREEARAFLEGLAIDLANDTVQLHSDFKSYEKVIRGAAYFSKVSNGEKLNEDSLHAYSNIFYNTTRFNANISRYEALKASGKLNIIENRALLNSIINYYQQTLPFLDMLNNGFNNYKTGQLGSYLDEHLVFKPDGTNNWEEVLRMPFINNALKRTKGALEIEAQYLHAIKQARILLQEIKNDV
jgi:hypothetical protein